MGQLEKPNLIKGATLCVLGYLCIALMGAAVKAIPTTIPTLTVLFFQNLICLILTLPTVFKKGFSNLKTQHPFLHLTRDLAGLLSFFALFLVIRYIPLVDGMLLQNAAPLWIPFVVWIWIKSKVSSHVWWDVGIGLVGIILIINPGAEIIKPQILIGLASGILLAISLVAIRRLRLTDPTYRILFYYFLAGSILTLPFIIANWTTLNGYTLLLLIGVGILMYLGQFFITHSFLHAKASVLSPISYTAILFSGLLGWIIWNEIPTWMALVGMIFVIAGGITTIILEQQALKRIVKN